MKRIFVLLFAVFLLLAMAGCGGETAIQAKPETITESETINLNVNEPHTFETEYGSYILTILEVFKTNWLEKDSGNSNHRVIVLSYSVENIDFKNSEYEGVFVNPSAFTLYDAQNQKLNEYSVLHDDFKSPSIVLPGAKDSFGISYILESPSDQVNVIFSRGSGQSYKTVTQLKELETVVAPATLEEAVDKAIESARAEKIKVATVENAGTDAPDDMNVEIYLKGKDNLTTKMVRDGILIQASDILKDLQPRSEIAQVCLFWSMPLVDSYGNKTDWNVVKILIKKETLDNINFDNFDWNKFPEISDDYYEHASLKQE